MMFAVRWPDGAERAYYSPSLVVADHLETGREYAACFTVGSVTVTGFRY
jgi:uncharacterized repeat protein (TIGR04042 family)